MVRCCLYIRGQFVLFHCLFIFLKLDGLYKQVQSAMAPRKKRKSVGQSSSVKRAPSAIQKQNKKKNDKKTKHTKNDSIQEIMNEVFVPVTGDKNNSDKNKEMKPPEDVCVVDDKNILSADFIPFSARPLQHCVPKVNDEDEANQAIEVCEVPETIVVIDDDDDDDDDIEAVSICVDDTSSSDSETESVNDSIQILGETQKSFCKKHPDKVSRSLTNTKVSPSVAKKRKIDDSIEILETIDSASGRAGKKVKIHKRTNFSSASSAISNSDDDRRISRNEDEEIVIVDTIDHDSRDSIKVMNDFIPLQMSSALVREKTRRKKNFVKRSHSRWNLDQKDQNTGAPHSIVFQDTVGIAPSSARYKSPLPSNPNQEADTDTYHNVYGNNVYNPNSVQKTGLRPVVIDGSNVAFGHGGKSFSTRGIEICVDYFVKRGHWVVAFVPLFRRSEVSEADRKILDELKKNNQLAFTPSRFLHGRRVASYDDRFIVQCAAELGGIVVSTDNYRDLVCENEAWRETIEKRLLMFTWVGDILMFPEDPNGRGGPRLEEFLRFPQ